MVIMLLCRARLGAGKMEQRPSPQDEYRRLSTKLKYAVDLRDTADAEARRLEEAVEGGAQGQELEERVKAARELLRRLEKERDAMDELIMRASNLMDRLRAISLLKRTTAFFGGILIFVGAMLITTSLFMVFLGIMGDAMARELERIVGLVGLALGVLIVLSGFVHQVP